MIGPSDAGKSYFFIKWKQFLGKELVSLFPRTLFGNNGVEFAKAALGDHTFLLLDELSRGSYLDTALLKELNTGFGGGVSGRNPGEKSGEFRNEASVFIATTWASSSRRATRWASGTSLTTTRLDTS